MIDSNRVIIRGESALGIHYASIYDFLTIRSIRNIGSIADLPYVSGVYLGLTPFQAGVFSTHLDDSSERLFFGQRAI